LALVVQSNPIFKAAQNVYVMRKPDIVILAFILIQWSISIPLISHINTPLI
jgi:hypothetical protein